MKVSYEGGILLWNIEKHVEIYYVINKSNKKNSSVDIVIWEIYSVIDELMTQQLTEKAKDQDLSLFSKCLKPDF